MTRSILFLFLLLSICSTVVSAQTPDPKSKSNSNATQTADTIPPAPATTAESTPVELARAALAALGGDKFKNLKSMWLTGSADLYAPNSSQSVPGKFSMVTAGDKVRIDINAQ